MANLFGRDLKRDTRQAELGKTAQRLATVFAAIKSRPASITVRVPTDLPDLPNSEARRSVCKYVLLAVYPIKSDYLMPACTHLRFWVCLCISTAVYV